MRLKYKLGLAIVTIGIAICLMTYQSYALWIANLAQTGENIVSVGCFDVEMEEINAPISLKNTYPVSDSKGLTQTPYTIKLSNTNCTTDASYTITLNTLTTNTMDNSKIKFAISTTTPTSGTNLGTYASTPSNINVETGNLPIENLDQSIIIQTGELRVGASVTYNIYLWIDESAGNEVQGQTFEASINVVSSAVTLEPITDQIIAQLDTSGACPTVNEDGTVQATAAESENGYLCSAPDDYGTSYYYRGNVTNNYVKFGTNELGQDMYWRIIRINGDGSIRMIYDGTSTHANGESSADRQVGTSTFNPEHDDNAYAGYMYGTVGASTYEDTHANINDSTIKDYLDNWYKTNIEDKSLSSYISDTLFCNDRSLLQEEPFEYSNWNYNQLGYGLEATAYRWFGDPSYAQPGYDAILINYPRLTCSQQNDRFTVNDEILGNGNLTYPIGLITADEVYLAGATDMPNSGYYLYTGNMYWTMSPTGLEENVMSIRAVDMNGVSAWTNTDGDYAGNPFGVRPTINLKADSLKVGSGTANDPYRVA